MRIFTLVALLAIAAMFTSDRATAQGSGSTSISTSFNSTNIPGGRDIWFAAGLKVQGTVTYPLTIYFHHQAISCSAFSLTVPDGELILDPSYTHAVTVLSGGKWITTSPPNEPGNYLISAAYTGSSSGVSGGLSPVTWSGTFSASRPGISLSWQWWSATYPGAVRSYDEGAIKPSDCSHCDQWGTGQAGWPELVNYDKDMSGLTPYTGGATGTRYTDSVLVTCADATLPVVSVSASATSVCTGDSITFTATAVNGGSAPSYQWKINGGNAGTNSATYTLHSPVSGEEISAVLTSNDSLALSSTAESNLITVTVNTTPAPATISGGTTLCTGGTLALTASAGGGVWSSSNTAIGIVSGSGTVTAVGSGTDIISYIISNSCGAAVATTTVTASPAFTISGTLSSPTCNGYTNGNVVTSVAPRDGHTYTYAWSNGSTSSGLWGVPAGTYSVTATNESGCAETAVYTVIQPDALASTYSVTDAYPHGGSNGAIYYGVSGGTWPYTYSWSNGATTQNITGLTAASYVVTVTDANSCSLTNWFSVNQPYGSGSRMANSAANTQPGTEAEAYPNPFSSVATISFSTPQGGNTTVEVYNAISGAKEATIFNDNTNAGQEYTCTLSGEQLASGVYLYKIVAAEKDVYTGRIVLVK